MSGFVSGGLWGLVLGGVGLAFVSQVSDLPAGNVPPLAPQVAAPQTALNENTGAVDVPQTPSGETELAVDVPRVAVPEAEVTAPVTDTTPPTPPEAPDIAATLTVPEDVSDPEIAAGLDAPELSRTVISPPVVPQPEEDVVIATEPAQPVPEVADPDSNEVAGVAEDAALEPAPVAPTPAPEPAQTPTEPVAAAPEPAADTAESDAAEEPITPEVVPEVADTTPEIAEPPAVEEPATEPAIVAVTDTNETPLPQVNSGVRVNRPGATPSETAGQDAEIVTDEETLGDAPALVRYAAAFEQVGDLPLMSILLLDDAEAGGSAAEVAALPFPATVVVDALSADANARMRTYRDAGVEVVMQTSLPLGAVPTDVEVAFEAAFDILPETVALFSGADGILQNNRAVTAQVIEVLKSEGRGLIVVERGLGNAIRGAAQAGLPAAPVLRDLDGAGTSAAAIGRALDQAAFRARQAGDGVMLARITDQSIAALQAWAVENNGSQITLAPASTILNKINAAE